MNGTIGGDTFASVTARVALVRYGAIPEVARFAIRTDAPLARGDDVVVETHRGVELGTFLEEIRPESRGGDGDGSIPQTQIVRIAVADDLAQRRDQLGECESHFARWQRRIADWRLQLELIDLEWTLDRGKLILYVLNDRGAECTKLALQAAAAGLGIIEVQPVNGGGLVAASQGGGCGSGGCGSGGCGH